MVPRFRILEELLTILKRCFVLCSFSRNDPFSFLDVRVIDGGGCCGEEACCTTFTDTIVVHFIPRWSLPASCQMKYPIARSRAAVALPAACFQVELAMGEYYLDAPIYMHSGVYLDGR